MIPQALQTALQHHQAGRLQEAEAIYRQVLQIQPDHPDALHLLGVIAHHVGRHEVAVELIGKAIEANPAVAEFHNTLGSVLQAQGRLEEAVTRYRQALTLQPEYAEAHYNLGNALVERGLLEEAVAQYRQAVALKPALAEAHNNLGNALRDQGMPDEAEAHYRQAVALKPAYAEAYSNWGMALHRQGKLEESAVRYQQALTLQPAFAEAHNNLGNALRDQGKLKEAAVHYRQAVALRPSFAEAFFNLGNLLKEEGDFEEACASYRQAAALKPAYAEAYSRWGAVLHQQGRLGEAIVRYQQAIAVRPDCAEAHYNLGNALRDAYKLQEAEAGYRRALAIKPDCVEAYTNLARLLHVQGKLQDAETCYRRALAIKPDSVAAHSSLLLAMSYGPDCDPAALAAELRSWNERHARPLMPQARRHANDPDPERRLRVGYVSADFRRHPVSFFLEPLFAAHDRAKVEVFCYSNTRVPDAVTQRFQASADVWRDIVDLADEAVAARILADGIDVLVDLSGHTMGNRLLVLARKPAPVQVAFGGTAMTTGLTAMDYRLTDRFLSPPDGSEWSSEELVRLPAFVGIYRPPAEAPEVTPLPARRNEHVTFACFNRLVKVTPNAVKRWSEILRRVRKARLILKDGMLKDPGQRARYLGLFEENGISTERIELLPRTPLADYLATYGRVDIALDPFPYNGCTTTCDALWMGVPVITLAGAMANGRMGVSLLSNLGLTRLIAANAEEYVRIAVELAADRGELAALRAGLRPLMAASSLCDPKTYAQGVEAAYRSMWRRWCERSQ